MRIGNQILLIGMVLLAPLNELAHAQPSGSGSNSSRTRTGNIEQYISGAEERFEEVKPDVEQNVDSWAGNDITGHKYWENYKGADEANSADGEDSIHSMGAFTDCQEKIHEHTFFQMFVDKIPVANACYLDVYQYAGIPSGICMRAQGAWCGTKIIMTSLVEYNFPAYKIDVSEQMFQSPYLDKTEVEEAIPDLKEINRRFGTEVAKHIDVVSRKSGKGANFGLEVTDFDSKVDKTAEETVEALNKFTSTGAYQDFEFTAPNATKIYSRNIVDTWNALSAQSIPGIPALMPGVPHEAKNHDFATDMPLGFAYSKFLTLNQNWGTLWSTFMQPGGERTCLRHNLSTGKSRGADFGNFEEASRQLFAARGDRTDSRMCLPNVGEVFPVMDSRRPSITDASYIGVEKGLQIFQRAIAPSQRHTYNRQADKLHVIRSPALAAESPVCADIDKMTRVNTSYKNANVKRARSGGQNTFLVFPMFKGCWGFRRSDFYWNIGIFEFNATSKLPSGKQRRQ